MGKFIGVLVLACLAACSTTIERRDFKSYTIGQTLTATVGDVLLVDQSGSVQKNKEWVGILASPNGWKITEVYSTDYIRKELIYSGISGNTIEIAYREYRGGLAAPAFFQSVKYDLRESRTIRFQKFQIEVIDANNQGITCRLLSDA